MKKIVLIDSGIGGLHILSACQKLLPNQDFVYVADNKNAPYGNKNSKQLKNIAVELVEYCLNNYSPQIIVLACNTLTVNTIKYLRKKFPRIQFVGTEPALKQARIYGGNTIILATESTQKHFFSLNKKISLQLKQEHKTLNLKYSISDKIYKLSIPNLATLIEDNMENLDILIPLLNNSFKKQKFQSCQNLVLGCTHYTAIKKQLQTALPNIKIFDNTIAVAKQVAKLSGPQATNQTKQNITFVCTTNSKEYEQKLKDYFERLK